MRPGRQNKNFVAVTDRICQFYNASFTLLHIVPEETSLEVLEQMEDTSSQIINIMNKNEKTS
jgi:hypothetical protein